MKLLIYPPIEFYGWMVQLLEADLCVHVPRLNAIDDYFAVLCDQHVAICADLERQPFECIKPAPQAFLEAFEEGYPIQLAIKAAEKYPILQPLDIRICDPH